LLVSLPLPAIPPVPPGGKLNLFVGSVAASAGASPPFDLTGGVPPPSVSATPSQVVPHAPGPASGGVISPSITSPSAAVRSGPVAAVTEPLDYRFGGIAAGWVGAGLLLGLLGDHIIRRYMRRLFVGLGSGVGAR
jgi:hypothetical protein